MKNIYIDTLQIHSNDTDIGFFVSPEIQGLEIPSIRLPSFDRPNIDGAIVPNQLYGGRLISFKGKVYGGSVSEYRTNRQLLESAVAIKRTDAGELLPLVLKFKTMSDLLLQVNCYTKQFSCPDKNIGFANYKLDVFTGDIYLLGQTEKVAQIYTFQGGGMAIPMGIPMSMNTGGDSLQTLNNAGNVPAKPTITLWGPLQNPVLTNLTTGEVMTFTYNLTTADQSIVVDTVNRTALYSSGLGATPVNVRQYLVGDFITIAPGDNEIKLSIASYNALGLATFQWRDSYSGI